jgi:hydroxymethylbilane synthase
VPITPIRQDARDALFSREKATKLADLPQGARIGTDSVRRASQLLNFRPDFQIIGLRGNVDTRLRKLHDPTYNYDAIMLALAGVSRLGLAEEVSEKLPYPVMLPAPGQGALAPECRTDDSRLNNILSSINDLPSRAEVECEKAFMAALGGGCQTPVGCKAEVVTHKDKLVARGFVGSPDGKQAIRVELEQAWTAGVNNELASDLGHKLADLALAQGAREILDTARANGYITPRK